MNRKFKSREEKIKFLKDLQIGKATLGQILPGKSECWIFDASTGIYTDLDTGKEITEAAYNLKLEIQGFKKDLIIKGPGIMFCGISQK